MPQTPSRHVFRRMHADAPNPDAQRTHARAIRNLRVSPEGVDVPYSQALVPGTPATSTTRVIGRAYDPATGYEYVFRWYANGKHAIWRYDPEAHHEEVMLSWTGLNFGTQPTIQAEVVGGMMAWVDGINPARSLRLSDFTLLQAAIDADLTGLYLTLNRQPPLLPVEVVTTDTGSGGINHLIDASLQFSYYYTYLDNQQSVLAPWSKLLDMRQPNGGGGYNNAALISVPTGIGRPGTLVASVTFVVRKGNTGTVYEFWTEETPEAYGDTGTWIVQTFYDSLGAALSSTRSVLPFDNVPTGPPKALGAEKNRIFLGNYPDGYEAPADVTLAVDPTPVTSMDLVTGRLWRPQKVKLGVVAVDLFGRNTGVIPGSVVEVTVPAFSPEVSPPTGVPYLNAIISVPNPYTLPAWVARFDVVRTDKNDVTFFLDGVGRITYEYPGGGFFDTALNGLPETDPSWGYTTGEPFPRKAVWLNIASLYPRARGYEFALGDRVSLTYRNPRNTGPDTLTVNDIAILGQSGDLIRLDIPPNTGWITDFDMLSDAEVTAGNARVMTDLWQSFDLDAGADLHGPVLYHSASGYGVYFSIYTPRTVGEDEYWEVAASVRPDQFVGTDSPTLPIGGDAWLLGVPAVPPLTHTHITIQEAGGNADLTSIDAWYLRDTENYQYEEYFWLWFFNTSPADIYPEWNTDQGRPQAIPDERLRGVIDFPTGLRWGEKLVSGTGLNELNTFPVGNEEILPVEYGAIMALKSATNEQGQGTVLLVYHTEEVEALYIEEQIFRSAQGQPTVALSDQVVAGRNLLEGGFGCIDPASISRDGGKLYHWCDKKGEPVRYSRAGLTPLGRVYDMRSVLRSWAINAQPYRSTRPMVIGGFDGYGREALLTFPTIYDGETVAVEGFTIAFSEEIDGGRGGFSSYYDFAPIYYLSLPNGLLSSPEDGRLWRHHFGAPGFSYGVAVVGEIEFTEPGAPLQPALWQAVSAEATRPIYPARVSNERGQTAIAFPSWVTDDERGAMTTALGLDQRGDDNDLVALNTGVELESITLDVLMRLDHLDMVAGSKVYAVTVLSVRKGNPLTS